MGKTNIPYLDETWAPTAGCSGKDEHGQPLPCRPRCWAAGMAHRFERDFTPRFQPEHLADPLHMRKPRVIGVTFGGDLFDAAITDEQIAAVFGVMAACPQHTFVVLTKQAQRMARWFAHASRRGQEYAVGISGHLDGCARGHGAPIPLGSVVGSVWPLPNVMLGVSVSTQADANARIPLLLRCPAAVRWVSAEPLLEAVDLTPWIDYCERRDMHKIIRTPDGRCARCEAFCGVSWVAAAAESGPRARPVPADAPGRLRDDCRKAGVLFAWKDQRGYPLLDGIRHAAIPTVTHA